MKKTSTALIIMLIFLTLPLFSQSMADLDRESSVLADRIKQYMRNTGGTKSVEIAAFAFSGAETPLGNYWRQNLANLLAGTPGLTLYMPGSAGRGDYVLTGEILDLGGLVRVFTRLVNKTDFAVIASWSSDLEKTPFLESLFSNPSSSRGYAVLRDIHEEDSRENPVPAAVGGLGISRTLHEDDRDWFLIQAERDMVASFETSGSLDTIMELYDDTGKMIAEDDDGGEEDNAKIVFPLTGGKSYIVMVRGYSGETGSYEFFVRESEFPDRAMEPNDTIDTAFRMGTDETITAYLGPNDPDWYSFSVRNQCLVRILTGGRIDKQLSLYDASGRELVMIDDSEQETNARISRFLEKGSYYILVKGYGKNIVGTYRLRIRIRENVVFDIYDPDSTPEEAKEIKIGETQRRIFIDEDDIDWVFFTVVNPGRYRIQAAGEKSSELDTYLELFDNNLELIAKDDDGGEGYSALIRQNLSPGRYYLRVKCLDDVTDNYYLLSLERD